MNEPFCPEVIRCALSALAAERAPHYVCAVSGGADSLALAHALAQCDVPLRYVHVNHHLHEDSADWARTVAAFGQQQGVPTRILEVHPAGDRNVEAAARDARYAALAADLRPHDVLLTAHHQEDQALTLLLQLLRGAGPAGLAAMPARTDCGAGEHWRPLLAQPADALRDYANRHALPVCVDPSNHDTRFDRNYLRAEIAPRLAARWPAFARTLSRSAAHCAEAAALLGQLARIDAPELHAGGGVDLSPAAVPDARRALNLLREFLRRHAVRAPATARLREFVRQVRHSDGDAAPSLDVDDAVLRVFERRVFVVPTSGAAIGGELALHPAQPLALPFPGGTLLWESAPTHAPLAVRFRAGGERYGCSPSRRLKHFFQQRQVLPWWRTQVPLICDGPDIVAIGDWWQDEGLAGRIVWSPDTRFTL